MTAILFLCYGLAAYAAFFATFLYTVGFLAGIAVPKGIDDGSTGSTLTAVAIDLALLSVFAVQHSVMARRSFKRWWTRIVPPAIERSTYVLAATLALALLLWQWRPIPAPTMWEVTQPRAVAAIWTLFAMGWAVLLLATFLINHFELFGLRQVWAAMFDRPIADPQFRTPLLYRYVRHPIYLGFLLAFWSTPTMSAGHLLFAIGCTGYILLGIAFEERDLVEQFGEQYRRYRRQVGMLIPSRRS